MKLLLLLLHELLLGLVVEELLLLLHAMEKGLLDLHMSVAAVRRQLRRQDARRRS